MYRIPIRRQVVPLDVYSLGQTPTGLQEAHHTVVKFSNTGSNGKPTIQIILTRFDLSFNILSNATLGVHPLQHNTIQDKNDILVLSPSTKFVIHDSPPRSSWHQIRLKCQLCGLVNRQPHLNAKYNWKFLIKSRPAGDVCVERQNRKQTVTVTNFNYNNRFDNRKQILIN